MSSYASRTTAPTTTTKYYNDKNYSPFVSAGYGMFQNNGNCTDYAYCRMTELMGKKSGLPTCNAGGWYAKVSSSFKKGSTPKLGAVIVWKKNNTTSNAGHVAVVEKINSDGSLLISESGYKNFIFRTKTIKSSYVYSSNYTLQGFIYCPTDFSENTASTYSGIFPTLPSKGYLGKGDKGTQVKYLQQFLNWCISVGLDVDSSFGSKTQTAVKNYQKAYSLDVDGYFGKKSLAKAKTITK